MNKNYVLSKEYAEYDVSTPHTPELREELGVWRWAGYHKYREQLAEILQGRIADIGGAEGPLGFGAEIVDLQEMDIHGNEIPASSIDDIEGRVDIIHSSHCLEHFDNPAAELQKWADKLRGLGVLILHVPLWYNGNLNPHFHPEHKWVFSIDGNIIERRYKIYPILPVLEMLFHSLLVTYTDNACLLYIGIKRVGLPGYDTDTLRFGNTIVKGE